MNKYFILAILRVSNLKYSFKIEKKNKQNLSRY